MVISAAPAVSYAIILTVREVTITVAAIAAEIFLNFFIIILLYYFLSHVFLRLQRADKTRCRNEKTYALFHGTLSASLEQNVNGGRA